MRHQTPICSSNVWNLSFTSNCKINLRNGLLITSLSRKVVSIAIPSPLVQMLFSIGKTTTPGKKTSQNDGKIKGKWKRKKFSRSRQSFINSPWKTVTMMKPDLREAFCSLQADRNLGAVFAMQKVGT